MCSARGLTSCHNQHRKHHSSSVQAGLGLVGDGYDQRPNAGGHAEPGCIYRGWQEVGCVQQEAGQGADLVFQPAQQVKVAGSGAEFCLSSRYTAVLNGI